MSDDRSDWRKSEIQLKYEGQMVDDVQDWNKIVMAFQAGSAELENDYPDWVKGTVYEEGSTAGKCVITDNQLHWPRGISNDGTYMYVADSDNHRIVKRLLFDLSYDSQIGTYGSGVDQFSYLRGISNDGTYMYVADSDNHRIVKRLLSDLSYDSK